MAGAGGDSRAQRSDGVAASCQPTRGALQWGARRHGREAQSVDASVVGNPHYSRLAPSAMAAGHCAELPCWSRAVVSRRRHAARELSSPLRVCAPCSATRPAARCCPIAALGAVACSQRAGRCSLSTVLTTGDGSAGWPHRVWRQADNPRARTLQLVRDRVAAHCTTSNSIKFAVRVGRNRLQSSHSSTSKSTRSTNRMVLEVDHCALLRSCVGQSAWLIGLDRHWTTGPRTTGPPPGPPLPPAGCRSTT